MDGIVDGIQVQGLCLLGQVHLAGAGTALGLGTHHQVLLGAVGHDLAQQLGKAGCMVSFLISVALVSLGDLGVALTLCHTGHGQVHTHPAGAIREAYDAGHRIFGESRPQELREKYDVLPKDIEWHMIGHLQTNKVKYIAPFVSLIHSVDSARLAETIQREAAKCGRTIEILLEIRVADEESKSGWELDDLMQYLRTAPFAQMPNICVRGVMGIATNTDDGEVIRRDFRELKRCFDLLQPNFGARFNTLSMGMSHDYPIAVECGSTMVRVGSLIFGERDYSKQ